MLGVEASGETRLVVAVVSDGQATIAGEHQ